MLQVIHSFGVPCELTIVSAHRTPDRMLEYARNAHKRGIKVIVAGAGGAAHLPGMVAALTPLPVVGVPVKPAGAHLDGLDALLSIVQVILVAEGPTTVQSSVPSVQNLTTLSLH